MRPISKITVCFFYISFILTSNAYPDQSIKTSKETTWSHTQTAETFEEHFISAGSFTPEEAAYKIRLFAGEGFSLLAEINKKPSEFPIEKLYKLEDIQLQMAGIAAAHEEFIPALVKFTNQSITEVMSNAYLWPLDKMEVREVIYRVTVGGRMSLEEAIVLSEVNTPPLIRFADQPSMTPATTIKGIRIHSGDILLSGDGDISSKILVRGNEFPGNFSHAAIVHVDAESGRATVIESIPEKGAVKTPIDTFLKRVHYRAMLLRLRPGHPALARDPIAPQKAANFILSKVSENIIPYDFKMDIGDMKSFFSSELVYRAYQGAGVDLWNSRSRLASPGAAKWLSSLGIGDLDIIIPSDLEYDPDLIPIAEWMDRDELIISRYENAAIDALLDGADIGDRLSYPIYKLPIAALLKGWSMVQKQMDERPAIPDGVGILAYLRHNSLRETIVPKLKEEVKISVSNFRRKKGHEPPYGKLYDMAAQSLLYKRSELAPALKSLHVKK